MPVPFTGDLVLIAIVEGKGLGRCWMVCGWMVVGRCDRGVEGRVLVQVDSGGVHGLCSIPFCRSWLDLGSIGPVVGFGNEKTPVLCRCWDCVGMVGVLGEEGVSWTSSIVTHFTDDACIVIDQFVTNLLNFQPSCL